MRSNDSKHRAADLASDPDVAAQRILPQARPDLIDCILDIGTHFSLPTQGAVDALVPVESKRLNGHPLAVSQTTELSPLICWNGVREISERIVHAAPTIRTSG